MQMRNKFWLSKGQITMRLFAFAALLALPLLVLGAQSASADYYCCGKEQGEHKVRWGYVIRDSVIFDSDSYHCETKIKVHGGTKVKVYCKNGWCHIKNFPFKNMWVLEYCLKLIHKEDGEGGDEGSEDGGDEGNQVGEGDEGGEGEREGGEGYKRSDYRRY
jgi:hypothetical protein